MSKLWLVLIILAYLGLLFFLAYWAEKNERSKWVNHPAVYVLSIAVYCSTWTYYGSVGVAASSGIRFLTIYLGPVLALPLWIVVMRKVIFLTKSHNISSIADFISLRYGNNRSLGAIVALLCIVGTIPYIALQLKAVSETFHILTDFQEIQPKNIFQDSTFYIAILLAIFAAFFGTLSSDATESKRGIIFSVAFESVLKLVFFTAFGVYVTYYLFNGTTDVYEQAAKIQSAKIMSGFGSLTDGFNWLFMILLSFIAIFLLPRQFLVSVVEYRGGTQLKNAIWGFPLYLLLFNLFVIFIAWGGMVLLGNSVNPDYYTLFIPLSQGHNWIAILVFFGGFSAAISMVVVSGLALSIMLSNNIIIPYGFIQNLAKNASSENSQTIKIIRRVSIFVMIIGAYIFYANFNSQQSLFSIGLISFVIIAQLAPSFFLGLYWNRGSSVAAKTGIIVGFLITFYTFLLPFLLKSVFGYTSFEEYGLFGISALKPYQLFGLNILEPVAHSFFWSIFFNTAFFLVLSVSFKGNYRERNYGEMFVNSRAVSRLQESAFVWKGEAYISDVKNLLDRFLGVPKANRALDIFRSKYNISPNEKIADARFINFSEKLLTGTIGSASAKILISNVAKEKPVTLVEVLKILEENKESIAVSKSLHEKSKKLLKLTNQLQNANEKLLEQDHSKDAFLDTVAHELKTPITAIQAASEVLMDDDMPDELKQQFLQNIQTDTERITKLINNILDLEKLASGRENLNLHPQDIVQTIQQTIQEVLPIAQKQNIQIYCKPQEKITVKYDEDKIVQVLTNLLSNALKFVSEKTGIIAVDVYDDKKFVYVEIEDNGKGVKKEDQPYIFDKFYQSKKQNVQKPSGSGFGLAICKHILELHQGKIWLDEQYTDGAKFIVKLPKN